MCVEKPTHVSVFDRGEQRKAPDVLTRSSAHPVIEVPATYGPGVPRNHCERICRATGAAAWAPKPPLSTVTTTTIDFLVALAGT